MRVENIEIAITGGLIKTAVMEDEYDDDVEDPASLIEKIKKAKVKADIFTFWQRLPEIKPKYDYYMEWDNVAAIPIKSFDHWWQEQINTKNRNIARKAPKKGVVVKVVDFSEELVKGIVNIYNESRIRQGKPFWHYGKDFDTVKKENSTYLDRSDFIGAYYNDELIGFINLVSYQGRFAHLMQIISKIEHRDKAPNNALIAKAVEACAERGIPFLVYARFDYGKKGSDTLADFKRHNGFEKILLPRYYIPLSTKGEIALRLRLHHGVVEILPEKLIVFLKNLRKKWYLRK